MQICKSLGLRIGEVAEMSEVEQHFYLQALKEEARQTNVDL